MCNVLLASFADTFLVCLFQFRYGLDSDFVESGNVRFLGHFRIL